MIVMKAMRGIAVKGENVHSRGFVPVVFGQQMLTTEYEAYAVILILVMPVQCVSLPRLVARPNEKYYCRLAINTQVFCRVERVCNVSAGSFSPPPKVDSMIVRLTPRKPPLKVIVSESFLEFVVASV